MRNSLRLFAVFGCATMCLACVHSAQVGPSLVPRDPTPLARCKVGVSEEKPLVTEWPASEKSHLEALIERGAVVVAYSGCELHVLDRCTVGKGSYKYKATTPSTDMVEIASEDELYARLPLGAVRLEGELKRSGRIAVQTSVAGQYSLTDAKPSDVPLEGECARATHVVSRIAIGAFRLIAGGKMSAGGGASLAGGPSAGTSTTREESVLSEAGDPAACRNASDAPATACKSPIQVFLDPLPKHAQEHGETLRAVRKDDRPTPDSVRVNFASSQPEDRWTLVTAEGAFVCELPCTRWVGSESRFKLKLDAARREDIATVDVPPDIGYSPGRTVQGHVGRHSWRPHNTHLVLWGSLVTFGGLVTLAVFQGQGGEGQGGDQNLLVGGGAVLGLGATMILIGLVARSTYHKVDFDIEPSTTTRSPQEESKFKIGPGSVMAAF